MSLSEQPAKKLLIDFLEIGAVGGSRRQYSPLDTLKIRGAIEAHGYLKVQDGCGNEYFSLRVEKEFDIQLITGGSLGWHRVYLESDEGVVLFQEKFWMDAGTCLKIGNNLLSQLWNSLYSSILRNRRSLILDGEVVPFFIRWVRDDTHVQKASVYLEKRTGEWIERFLDRQTDNGMIYDYVVDINAKKERIEVFGDHYHRIEPQNGLRWERLPSEADVEYLLVESLYRAWQAHGDETRIRRYLPAMEKALHYCMNAPLRWDPGRQLVKRPYTIDTWDFKFFGFTRDGIADEKALQDAVFNVYPDTPMCIMHGDNTGMYQACSQLAKMFTAIGEAEKSEEWNMRAEHFRERTNSVCWNGEYYDHWVPVTPLDLDQGGVDGCKAFTLSNAYNLNRGVATHEQCVSIIRKYLQLKEDLKDTHIAEWIAAWPCWPKGFSGIPANYYVNGGILTIVAGELARGAFAHGFEGYGADILLRLAGMLRMNEEECRRDPEILMQPYLFCGYTPEGEVMDGIPNIWGQAAVLAAFVEGIAGVVDLACKYQRVLLSPRWMAAGVDQAQVQVRYPASDGYVAYHYRYEPEEGRITLAFSGNAENWELQVLLPENAEVVDVVLHGESVEWYPYSIETSEYVKLEVVACSCGQLEIRLVGGTS